MKSMIGNVENTLELDRFREERGLMSGRESRAFGKSLREICPCDSQGDWKIRHNRDSSIDLIHAHAKTGDRHAIAGYLGEGEDYDKAMARFAVSYADQNEIDYELFRKHLPAFQEI